MTTLQTTPSVWIAGKESKHVQSMIQRIAHFAQGHELDELELSRFRERVLHDIGTHATAWLVVTSGSRWSADLIQLAHECREVNSGFRCLVLVPLKTWNPDSSSVWPQDTLYIDADSLSTTVIDRLRSETHANRIATQRRRHIERLQKRSA